jgi:hypothetical protein
MKYNIHINQRAAIENEFDIDIIDLAIFDFIKDFGGSNNCTKIQTDDGIYFWIAHKEIIRQLPLINIKSSQGIIKRIENLIKCKLLEKHQNCERYSKSLYRFGQNYDKMLFGSLKPNLLPPNESLETPQRKFSPPPNESLGNNNNNNNSINNESGNPEISFKSKIFTKWSKEEFKSSIQEARVKRDENPKQPNFTKKMLNEFYLYWVAPHKSGKLYFATQDKWDTFQRLISWQARDNNKN